MYTTLKLLGRKKVLGFTIIEMVVVIGIISMLSSIILISLNKSRLRSRDARRISDIQSMQIALDLYYNDNGYFPLMIYGTGGLSPKYIPRVPSDPNSNAVCIVGTEGNCYKYRSLGQGGSGVCSASNLPIRYHLGAVLEEAANKALKGDTDWNANSSNIGCNGLADFDGLSSACNTRPGGLPPPPLGTTDKCFDVTQ